MIENWSADWFVFQTASIATPQKTSTVTAQSKVGCISTVYTIQVQEKLDIVQFETTMSHVPKRVTGSLNSKETGIDVSFVGLETRLSITRVGDSLSIVNEDTESGREAFDVESVTTMVQLEYVQDMSDSKIIVLFQIEAVVVVESQAQEYEIVHASLLLKVYEGLIFPVGVDTGVISFKVGGVVSKVIVLSVEVEALFQFPVKSKTVQLGIEAVTTHPLRTSILTWYHQATWVMLISPKVEVDHVVSISHHVKDNSSISSSKLAKNKTGEVEVGSIWEGFWSIVTDGIVSCI